MNNIQLYSNRFFFDCLKLFQSNIPKFFHSSEEVLFQNYLSKENSNYYLLFNVNHQLMAAGGYELEKNKNIISLTWGMVDYCCHNQGYGKYLTEYRLKNILNNFPKLDIVLNTSQKTFGFYEQFGFKVVNIKKDGYGPGLDRYNMIINKT